MTGIRFGLTQRVEVSATGERRDSLDQAWTRLAESLGVIPVPLPNLSSTIIGQSGNGSALCDEWLKRHPIDGLILTGGNTPVLEGGEALPDMAVERDTFEYLLIRHLPPRRIPVFGVCRGMQAINVCLGGTLRRVDNHVAKRHPIRMAEGRHPGHVEVNSFHGWGMYQEDLASGLKAWAWSEDGVVEALSHTSLPIVAIMWHPERETPFRESDIELIRRSMS